jgi:DNA repair ATPase RecN
MKTKLPIICLVLARASCEKKTEVSDQPPPVTIKMDAPAPEDEASPSLDDEIAESRRILLRSHAIMDLIAAHQKIARDEGFADEYRGLLRDSRSAGEIATLQDSLSEVRNDIRDLSSQIPELENKIKDLSKPGDPSYELELATFLADMAETKLAVGRAYRANARNSGELEKILEQMQKISADHVLAGSYPRAE